MNSGSVKMPHLRHFTGTWVETAREGAPGFFEGLGLGWLERRAVLRSTAGAETHAVWCAPPAIYVKETGGRHVLEDVLRIGEQSVVRREVDGTGLLQHVAVLLRSLPLPAGVPAGVPGLEFKVATARGVVEVRRSLPSSDTMVVRHRHMKTGASMTKTFERVLSDAPMVPRRFLQPEFSSLPVTAGRERSGGSGEGGAQVVGGEREAVTVYTRLLSQGEAPSYNTRGYPFVGRGYRPKLTLLGCLRSLFTLHNESFNIWSHLVAAVMFARLARQRFLSTATSHQGRRRLAPLFVALGGTAVFGTSAVAHCFCAHGKRTNDRCFACDKACISLFMWTCIVGSSWSKFRLPTERAPFGAFFLTGTIGSVLSALGVSGMLQGSVDTPKWFNVAMFSAQAACGLLPPIMEWAATSRADLRHLIISKASLACALSIVGAAAYSSNWPEKADPSKERIVYSHGIMHVNVALSCAVAFHGFSQYADMAMR
jgi:predicted membrane channel-forming protein YqfA (hemolysin III family)